MGKLEENLIKKHNKKLSSFLRSYLVLDSVGRNNKAVTYSTAMKLREKMFNELNDFLRQELLSYRREIEKSL